MRRRRLLATVTTAVVLTATLTGCASDSDEATPAAGRAHGPLDELMARIDGVPLTADSADDGRARIVAQERAIARMVVECMHEQGFTYLVGPDGHNTQVGGEISTAVDPEEPLGPLEFAQRYGFGISHRPAAWDQAATTTPWVDPNADQLSAMSATERAAWQQALAGNPSNDDEYWWRDAGCYGQAQGIVWGLETAEDFQGLRDEVARHHESVATHARSLAVEADWASCMLDAGHGDLTTRRAMTFDLWDEWADIEGWGPFNELAETWDWEANPEGPPLPDRSPEAIAAFEARELALAVASEHCIADVDYWARTDEVRVDLQAEFVERHGAELEAWAQHEEERRAGWTS